MTFLLLLFGFFLAGLGMGVLAGWWLRGEVALARRVTGRTVDLTGRVPRP